MPPDSASENLVQFLLLTKIFVFIQLIASTAVMRVVLRLNFVFNKVKTRAITTECRLPGYVVLLCFSSHPIVLDTGSGHADKLVRRKTPSHKHLNVVIRKGFGPTAVVVAQGEGFQLAAYE